VPDHFYCCFTAFLRFYAVEEAWRHDDTSTFCLYFPLLFSSLFTARRHRPRLYCRRDASYRQCFIGFSDGVFADAYAFFSTRRGAGAMLFCRCFRCAAVRRCHANVAQHYIIKPAMLYAESSATSAVLYGAICRLYALRLSAFYAAISAPIYKMKREASRQYAEHACRPSQPPVEARYEAAAQRYARLMLRVMTPPSCRAPPLASPAAFLRRYAARRIYAIISRHHEALMRSSMRRHE